jgi:adenine-specific DNA-methyltransferase
VNTDINEVPSSSPDFRTDLARQLADLVPEAISDGKIDVSKLTELLAEDVADESERFGLFWPGRRQALRAAQEPTTATLRPDRKHSKDWDTTQNLFIEGDNLQVLKVLQRLYHSKIKMIYIDPPYNTGGDFIYPDDYREGLQAYLEFTRQVDDSGRKLSTNPESAGRFHSNWLNMMFPRLKLARNLLADEGVIFVSIDDHERDNLKRLMDEVFGEASFVGAVVWRKKASPDSRSTIGSVHDYLLCYVRNPTDPKAAVGKMSLSEKRQVSFSNPDDDPRGPWASVDMTGMTARATKEQFFQAALPSGRVIGPPPNRSWGLAERTFVELREDNRIWFVKNGNSVPRIKRFFSEAEGQTVPSYWDFSEAGSNEEATDEVTALFDGKRVFDTPKPVRLMARLLEIGTRPNQADVVLDFFAGSASMADAVLRANAEDGGDRRFIMVQLPEPTAAGSVPCSAGFKTISAISRDRIRRVGVALSREADGQLELRPPGDIGFRTYALGDTSFSKWRVSSDTNADALADHLVTLQDSARDDASEGDLLAEVLIKRGFSLLSPYVKADIEGLRWWSIGDGLLIAYLDEHTKPTLDQLRAAVASKPEQLVILEDVFRGDDELKTNLAQECRSAAIELWTV